MPISVLVARACRVEPPPHFSLHFFESPNGTYTKARFGLPISRVACAASSREVVALRGAAPGGLADLPGPLPGGAHLLHRLLRGQEVPARPWTEPFWYPSFPHQGKLAARPWTALWCHFFPQGNSLDRFKRGGDGLLWYEEQSDFLTPLWEAS